MKPQPSTDIRSSTDEAARLFSNDEQIVPGPGSFASRDEAALAEAVGAFTVSPLVRLVDPTAHPIVDELSFTMAIVDRMLLHASTLVHRAEVAGVPGRDGAKIARDWVAGRTGLPKQEAGRLVAVGRHGRKVPRSREAVEHGQLGFVALAAAARAVDRVPKADHAALDAEMAAARADGWELEALGWARHWADANDPDRLARDVALERDQRSVNFQDRLGGGMSLQAELDRESAVPIRALLLAAHPVDAADDRTAEQRRADALTDTARGDRSSTAQPELIVTVDHQSLVDGLGLGEVLDHAGSRLPAETIRRMACDAKLIPTSLDSAGVPLDAGRARRLPSESQRRMLELRDRGCRAPGCATRHQWTDAHHVVHWLDGGPTDLSNVVLLCRHHHTQVHELGLDLTLTEKAALIVRSTTGRWIGATIPPPKP